MYRVPGKCKSGARTSSCCAHVMAALYAAGFLAHNPGAWNSAWAEYNLLDTANPAGYTTDILTGLYT